MIVLRQKIINLLLVISLLVQSFFQPAIGFNRTNRFGHRRKSNEKVKISSTFELEMKRASLTDLINFIRDIIAGLIIPTTGEVNGKAYDISWSSKQPGTKTNKFKGQEISLNLLIMDKYASIIRSFGGPRRQFPVGSQVLKSSRHTQRPVLQTIIDFIEEQTKHYYARDIGHFMVQQAAKFTSIYFSSSATLISAGLMTISSWLEKMDNPELKKSKSKSKSKPKLKPRRYQDIYND